MDRCKLTPTPCRPSVPLQCHAHVSWHSAGKIDDLDLQLVSARSKVPFPQLMDFLRHAGQGVLPARLLLIDRASLVRAQLVRKAIDLHLAPAVAHRALDDLDRAP